MRIIGLLTATILFISALPANSEEIVMKCSGDTFKYKSGILRKSIQIRQDGQWQSWCSEKHWKLSINDQSAICLFKRFQPTIKIDGVPAIGHSIILDFYLKESTLKGIYVPDFLIRTISCY